MKHLKKLAGVLLALVMVMALAAPAFATTGVGAVPSRDPGSENQSGPNVKGKITIDNTKKGETYTLYKIFDLESYNETAKAYTYTIDSTSPWYNFVNGVEGKKYITLTEYGTNTGKFTVTWKDNVSEQAADVQLFAQAALAYATANSSSITGNSKTATEDDQALVWPDLDLGYYLVDSSMGTLCSLTTTNNNVTVHEKNQEPTVDKTVAEDSKEGQEGEYGKKNDADIGQTVKFQATITAMKGASKYVYHDVMSEGLTFGSVTGVTLNGTAVAETDYTVKTKTTDPAVSDNCTFEVEFTQAFCDTLADNNSIVISYTATVNENAVIGGTGNENKGELTYGDKGKTQPSTTTTYVWEFDVEKYATVNDAPTRLEDATFTLSKNANGSTPISFIKEDDTTYRVAKAGETGGVTEITTDTTGKFKLKGLDADTYYLTETKAPEGYNKLTAPVEIVITGTANETGDTPAGTVSQVTTGTDGTKITTAADDKLIQVENKTGSQLPETGGIGTTIFYIVGGVLAVGAVVVLIAKRRTGSDEE